MTQTNLFKGQALTMIMSAPDQSIFKRPMSYGARDALSAMLEWSAAWTSLYGHNPRSMMTDFCERWSQLRYEEAVQLYDVDRYVATIVGAKNPQSKAKLGTGIKPKTKEELLDIMCLEKLFDSAWVHKHSIPKRNNIGDISQYPELYNWITGYFLTGDFSLIDLGKLAEMGRTCKVDIIKREAQGITDRDKHSIAYLYAVVRGVTSREEIQKHRDTLEDKENLQKLAALGGLAIEAENKVARKADENERERWERERGFAEFYRSLKTD